MHSIRQDMEEFREQLGEGSMQRAYRALLSFMTSLRTHFKNSDAGFPVSGLYQGYMDMTYFALFPPSLKRQGLKIAIVFNYDAFSLEVWLSGRNRHILEQYWELFKDSQWPAYRIATPATGMDSIVECDLAKDFDLSDPDALTAIIEAGTVAFIDEMESFLSEHQPREEARVSGNGSL